MVQGWSPDGTVIFRSNRHGVPSIPSTLYEVSTAGGLPTAIPVQRSAYGEYSGDGQYLAYTPIVSWDQEWRNYRGGQALPIWIMDVKTGDVVRTPQLDRERHSDPVWIDRKVYYISERDYASNVWSYDMESGTESQITFHKKYEVKNIDAKGKDIVYEQGGYLHLFQEGDQSATQINIQVKGDMNFSRPRWQSVSGSALQNPNISPNGKRAIFESRGDIVSIPKKDGSARHLTSSPAHAERAPIWSPTGDQVAYFSDESGEYQLVLADQMGAVQKRYDIPAHTFYYQPDWAPDGSALAFTDTDYNIWTVSTSTGLAKKIDTDRYAHPNRTFNPTWSPDSRYLAYTKQQDSHFKSVFIHDTQDGTTHHVTQGLADMISPIFDQSGKYLYYLVSTDYGLTSGWLDMSSYDPSVTRSLFLTVLQEDGTSPLLPSSDDEEITEDEKDNSKDEAASDEDKNNSEAEEEKIPAIDFQNIMMRSVAVADMTGEYIALDRAPSGKVMITESDDSEIKVYSYDFEEKKAEEYVSGISQMVTSSNGEHTLFSKGGTWYISSLSGKPDMEADALTIDLKQKINPQEEYHQMFKEGWRFMRDYLYVDNVHGAPWDTVWDWYAPWINHVRYRTDLNYVIDIMSGEVSIGHSFVYGGDMPDVDHVAIGLLGADYTIENDLYKISKIYSGESWNPDVQAPLFAPGINISEGDYITSVSGKALSGNDNIYSLFEETDDQQVTLSVKSTLQEAPREVTVVPTSGERGLRRHDWMEANRKKVSELSDGKLAYVYVPNTGGGGFTSFNRYYFSQQDKKGVIIDERNNGGGSAADYMIDIMSRELFGYFNSNAGDKRPWTTPISGIWGPKVMIINESAGSGGDLLPYMFKAKGIGPLVGTRTWGGLVGTWDTPAFIDGGRMVAPRGGFFDIDGEWAVEGEGISPDIEVLQDPKLMMQGKDPQLEAAVKEAMRLLEENEFQIKAEPAAPQRWKRPAGWNE